MSYTTTPVAIYETSVPEYTTTSVPVYETRAPYQNVNIQQSQQVIEVNQENSYSSTNQYTSQNYEDTDDQNYTFLFIYAIFFATMYNPVLIFSFLKTGFLPLSSILCIYISIIISLKYGAAVSFKTTNIILFIIIFIILLLLAFHWRRKNYNTRKNKSEADKFFGSLFEVPLLLSCSCIILTAISISSITNMFDFDTTPTIVDSTAIADTTGIVETGIGNTTGNDI